MKKIKEEVKKTPEDTAQSAEGVSRPIVLFGFDDRLSDKPPPGHTEPSINIDNVSRSWVLNLH